MILNDNTYDDFNIHIDVGTFNHYGALNNVINCESNQVITDNVVLNADSSKGDVTFDILTERNQCNTLYCDFEKGYDVIDAVCDTDETGSVTSDVFINSTINDTSSNMASIDQDTTYRIGQDVHSVPSSNELCSPNNILNCDSSVPNVTEDPNEDLTKFSKINAKNMVFSHLNVNSLSNKFMEIHNILHKGLSDILFLSETKLDSSYPNAQFNVKQFSIHRVDRNAHGGGLVCYVKETIPHRNRADISINDNGIESIVIQIKTSSRNMFFLHIYKPPNVHVNFLSNALEIMLNKCLSESETVYVIGDLNINFANSANNLSEICDTYDLKQLIKDPTCFKSINNPTILDIILTNSPKSIKQTVNLSIGISDFHNYVSAALKLFCPSDEPRVVHYRSFKKFNDESYINDLKTAPFHVSQIFDDVDDELWFHNTLLLQVIDNNAPWKQKTVKHKQLPYMNNNLRKAINVKAALRRKFQRSKCQLSWQNFKNQRNLVNKLKRSSLRKYFDENCNTEKSKGKHFWEVVKPFMTNKNKNSNNQNIILYDNNALVSRPIDVSNVFNKFFTNITNDFCEPDEVTQMSADQVIDHYKDHPSVKLIKQNSINNQQLFNFSQVDQSLILKKLKCLNPKKATGFDQISPKFLKIGCNIISTSLTPIVNRCIESYQFPNINKKAEVTPLYKKSDQLAKENYRPVSVLTATSKIFEGVLCDQLLNFMSPTLSNDLSAYRKHYSCNNVLVKCIESWRKAVDNNCHVGCILIDLSKAFDSLPHGLLVAKLHAYGVSIESCSYVMNYLKNRRQLVKLGNVRGEWLNLKTGVPQGSLFGPLLFNIFMNDFLIDLKQMCEVYNYADDNTLSFSHRDLSVVKDKLEKASERAIIWFKVNYMKANPSKFQAICFSRDNQQIEFKVEDNVIKCEEVVKLLGIHIDQRLNFDYHVSNLSKKAARQINALQRICKHIDYEGRLKVYEAFIASNFVYCSVAYNSFMLSQSRKIEKLNKRALRIVCNKYDGTYDDLLKETGKEMLYVNRKNNLVEFVFKVINNAAPPMESNFFTKQVSPYNMRDSNKLVLPTFNTIQYGKKSIRYQGPSLWNSLPSDVKCFQEFNNFKTALRNSKCLNRCNCTLCVLCIRNSL